MHSEASTTRKATVGDRPDAPAESAPEKTAAFLSKELGAQRMQRALDHIQRAQQELDRALEQLSPILGGARLWSAGGPVSARLRAYWDKVWDLFNQLRKKGGPQVAGYLLEAERDRSTHDGRQLQAKPDAAQAREPHSLVVESGQEYPVTAAMLAEHGEAKVRRAVGAILKVYPDPSIIRNRLGLLGAFLSHLQEPAAVGTGGSRSDG